MSGREWSPGLSEYEAATSGATVSMYNSQFWKTPRIHYPILKLTSSFTFLVSYR